MMLGDNTFPLNMMPDILQKIAPIINPLFHLNRILRGAWMGSMQMEVISVVYIIATIVILCFISYRYDKLVDNF